jgi:hypothetical protein
MRTPQISSCLTPLLPNGVEPSLQLVFIENRVAVPVPCAVVADASQFLGVPEDSEPETLSFDGPATAQAVDGQRGALWAGNLICV